MKDDAREMTVSYFSKWASYADSTGSSVVVFQMMAMMLRMRRTREPCISSWGRFGREFVT